jgi:hypothetical protein
VPSRRSDSETCCLFVYSPHREYYWSWFGRKAGHDSESKRNARSTSELERRIIYRVARTKYIASLHPKSQTKRITAVCFERTGSSANHLVYMDSFNSHDSLPVIPVFTTSIASSSPSARPSSPPSHHASCPSLRSRRPPSCWRTIGQPGGSAHQRARGPRWCRWQPGP